MCNMVVENISHQRLQARNEKLKKKTIGID